ncbi:protein GVQW3-like [Drosophila biarmipes]|uniref:protein GVQW3-like n=1 Tax=Drosophila biarmipes TaxID=125945 RepID=UPI0021CC60CB|nr:protein GVQW3-like [Drosophila biarmipes]
MLTVAYGETVLSKKNVYKWYKLFQDVREDANDEPRSGRPSKHGYDIETKANRHNGRAQEFLPYGRTVNKQYYLEVMLRLREAI